MSILLSIIVPVYNVGSFLPKCINSIISQTFTDFELILVDDGSTDNSVEICDAAAKKDSRVRVIHKENGGVVSARKAGLSVAVGKYAGYVDGDDWIDEHMYEHMVNAMEKYNCDMVMCDVEHENKSVPFSSGSTHINISGGYYNREQLENNVFPKMIYTGVFYKFGIYPVIWISSTKEKNSLNIKWRLMTIFAPVRTRLVYIRICLNVTVCISWKICLCIITDVPALK